MITLELNGIEHEGFTSISVTRSLNAISGAYSFNLTSDGKVSLPTYGGQPCRVLIGDIPVVNGFIETISASYDSSEHTLSLTGRDKTADVIDSSTLIDEVTANVSLKSLIQQALSTNGIYDILVKNNVFGLAHFGANDTEAAECGETIFSFISKYAKKRNVLLTSDGDGNIVITRVGTQQAETSLINAVNGEENNILTATGNYNATQLFHKYVVRAQKNPVVEWKGRPTEVTPNTAAAEDQSAEITDGDIRETRTLEISGQLTGSKNDCQDLVGWTSNIRRGKGFKYTATVQGFHQDEAKTRLWVPNELVMIQDDFIGASESLESTMLIDKVTYNFDTDGGSTTTIECIDKNSYSIQKPSPITAGNNATPIWHGRALS